MEIWNLDLSRFRMVEKKLVCKWSGFWMGSKIRKPDQLNLEKMAAIVSKTMWNPEKMSRFWMVWCPNGWDHSYRSFETQTVWNPIFKKPGFQMFLDFEWSDFRSPTVPLNWNTGQIRYKHPNCTSWYDFFYVTMFRRDRWKLFHQSLSNSERHPDQSTKL